MSTAELQALVAYESMFDNTAHAAEAIVKGLQKAGFEAHSVPVTSLASTGPFDVDLVVLDAPTHAFSLSRPATRADAVRQGAPAERAGIGAREWIATINPERFGTPLIAVFDTRVAEVRRLPLAAGLTAARLLRRRGFRLLRKPVAFLVEDTRGPLSAGEEAHAERWGQMIGDACRDELDNAA
ncbi:MULTISPECIES: flavodoxin/nitric oxide synthase [Nocardioides]|uniref:Flavodoxin-like domain-containing protein n=1 Tax=Nocardioides vastitatis TaxID=2568655 RepID=A0ABW0ZLA5_9ACTN|nr:flavodoxin/nitric oxide synthase [Nocardioides sp.]THJ06213.1 flavodoxin/nitric oxide synthase [Nocardioides sp.]